MQTRNVHFPLKEVKQKKEEIVSRTRAIREGGWGPGIYADEKIK